LRVHSNFNSFALLTESHLAQHYTHKNYCLFPKVIVVTRTRHSAKLTYITCLVT